MGDIQANLFDAGREALLTPVIPGLTYIPEYITRQDEEALLNAINSQPWLNDLKRRVQHYGYRYDYKARAVTHALKLGELPEWLMSYCEALYQKRLFLEIPDQVIVNEYQPGQGISAHIDCVPCFEGTIASLSLGSPCVMEFTREREKVPMLLEPRSLIILSGDARYQWKHAIAARKSDRLNGTAYLRGLRVSLTFRKMIGVE